MAPLQDVGSGAIFCFTLAQSTKHNMKKLISILFISSVLMYGCQQEAEIITPLCQQNNTGTFTVKSYMEDPYKVFVNGSYQGMVSAYGESSWTIAGGTYGTTYEQASGFWFSPSVHTASITVITTKDDINA